MADDTTPVSISDIAGHPMHLYSMSGDETLGGQPGGPFEYRLELLSPDTEIKPHEVLGQKATIRLKSPDNHVRYFNGHVGVFSYLGMSGTSAVYQATLKPWLWFLNFTADCRIFPDKTVPEIVKSVFRKYGQADFKEALSMDHPSYNHVVQYRETDFNFVSRLLQQEGIYCFFKHEAGKHTVVLADGLSAHEVALGYEQIRYMPPTHSGRGQKICFDYWKVTQEIKPNACALNDFDFENAHANLLAKRQSIPDEERHSTGEVFDYPGRYLGQQRGEALADLRIQELHEESQTIEVEGNPWGLGVGNIFTLPNPPRSEKSIEFLVTSAHYEIRSPDLRSGSGSGHEEPFSAKYTLLPSSEQFRPRRSTPRPSVLGPQTAIVVGSKKTEKNDTEEILTDSFGRVRVRFHWERIGSNHPEIRGDQDLGDEDNTCWVRVAQMWAGKRWGSMHIPRIGQEVVVEFLEGDPDRPLVTGSVYNADNMPPYELPANKTQSGIKSRSTKGGDGNNFNEIRFEDKKGHEELHMQAERDMSTHVKHDQSLSVDVNRSIMVGGDEITTIHGKRTTTVKKDDEKTVHGSETTTVDLNRALIVTGESKTEVSKKATLTFSADRETAVKGTDEATVGKKVLKQGGTKLECAEGNFDLKTEGWLKITHAGAQVHIDDKGKMTIQTDKELLLLANGTSAAFCDGKVKISAEKEATISVGNNAVKVDATGITTTANNMTMTATGLMQMTAPLITEN
jgi:type VI secretion system secreted protein VgrG